MKKFLLLLMMLFFSACQKEPDLKLDTKTLEINDFIWKGLNTYYLWKDVVPDLADQKFADQEALNKYLDNFPDSKAFFKSLLYERGTVDRWSWIVTDYVALMNMFQGITKSTGMHIGLVYEPGSTQNIFAYVKYVVPNTDAAAKGVQRGYLFRKINGTYLTVDNYRELLDNDVLDIEWAQWNGSSLIDTGQVVALQKTEVHENPVYLKKIIQHNNYKTGYLMYNSFTSNYDNILNEAFAYFQAEQVDNLVLDLRYNPGGSVQTMQYLASMITGQFTGQVLLKYQWHSQLQRWMEENYPNTLQRYFVDTMTNGQAIHHLNLPKIYVIATKNSASASESLINNLKPYIQVIQIGTETHGKYTASITLFDSPDFSYDKVNPNHHWAMQPIVLKISNAAGVSDFVNGLTPDIYQPENYFNLGVLGETAEPLLQTALQIIEGNTPKRQPNSSVYFKEIYYKPQALFDEMYLIRYPKVNFK